MSDTFLLSLLLQLRANFRCSRKVLISVYSPFRIRNFFIQWRSVFIAFRRSVRIQKKGTDCHCFLFIACTLKQHDSFLAGRDSRTHSRKTTCTVFSPLERGNFWDTFVREVLHAAKQKVGQVKLAVNSSALYDNWENKPLGKEIRLVLSNS